MGKLHKFTYYLLGLLCASAFAVQALAADKVNLPVDRHGFLKVSGDTFRHPTTAKIREAVSAANPHVERLPGGGLSQSLPSNIEISATKQTSPISAKVKAGVPALKNGAKTLLKGGMAGIVVTAGIDALLDGIGALIEDGQVVRKEALFLDDSEVPADAISSHATWVNSKLDVGPNYFAVGSRPSYSSGVVVGYETKYCSHRTDGLAFIGLGGSQGQLCYFSPDSHPGTPLFNDPLSSADIDYAVDTFYNPEPEDWQLLARHVDPSSPDVFAEIASIPSIMTPPTTKTIYDADGNPVEIQETNIWYDFDITDNNTKQPAVDIKENKETKTYDAHGRLTGKETTTSTSKAASASASSSSSSSVDLDIPTDCEFMPTVCRFLAWFQEPDPELSNEPDLESLRHDLEPERNYQVGSSTAGCPAPITISLSMFPSTEVSLQPLCDFVDLLRPLLLAFASYFATLIVLRAF